MSQLTIDDLIEQAVSKVIEERPQLGPFSSYLRNCVVAYHMRRELDPEKIAELDELEQQTSTQRSAERFRLEADELEQTLDRLALIEVLTCDDHGQEAPYPEASRIAFHLAHLDTDDIEPACKAFLERVAFHRMMRGEAQSSP